MASKAIKRFNIFFDTNILETRYGGDLLMFGDFKFPSDYQKILDFIETNNLNNNVDLCIPEVVWKEIIQHMRAGYISQKSSASEKIRTFQRSFGSLLNINYEFIIDNEIKYEEHLNKLSKDFWENEGKDCKKIPHPKSRVTVDTLLDKALRKGKPFSEAKGSSGKKYSDAGLKDALIVESMMEYCNGEDIIGILFSKDSDFTTMFDGDLKKKFSVFNSVDKLIDYLESQNNLNKEKLVRQKFENDSYLKESVVKESGNTYDESVTDFNVRNVNQSDDNEIFVVTIFATINEAKYIFEVKYDLEANEILDSSSKIENE